MVACGMQALPRRAEWDLPVASVSPDGATLFTTRLYARSGVSGYAYVYGEERLTDLRTLSELRRVGKERP